MNGLIQMLSEAGLIISALRQKIKELQSVIGHQAKQMAKLEDNGLVDKVEMPQRAKAE